MGDKIDWGQYGGTKGSSISHYVIDLVNFVLYNQDLKTVASWSNNMSGAFFNASDT